MRWRMLLLAMLGLLVGAVGPSFGAGLIIVDEAHWWPGPVPPEPVPPRPHPPWPRPPWPRPVPPPRAYIFAPLEVLSVKVNTRISEQVAVTSIDQEFHNPHDARLEGTFLLPVPKGAQLDKFSMEIDGRQVAAELLAAEKARRIYEDIVRRAKDPALMEYAGRDVLKVRIFPIEPHSRKRIKLAYTQLLKADDGLVSYVLPLNTEKFSAKPIGNVSVKVELESKRPLKSIYSPSHAVEIKRHGSLRATAGYEADNVKPDADFALYFAPEKDEIGLHLLTHRASDEEGYFLLLASPGVDTKEKGLVSKDVAFVLDTSGSMAGKKLEQAKKALLFCVENLNDGDRFEILRFSTEVEPLFGELSEATRGYRERAREFITGLKPIGGTAIDEALKRAQQLRSRDHREDSSQARKDDRPFVIIFLTDGRPTIGTTDEDQIVSQAARRGADQTRIFCFGIGLDVNTHLLDRITEQTRAFSQYVLPEEDLEVKVSSFFSKINAPVLANPRLKFSGDIRVSRLYPSPLPDLFKGEQLVLVGRYSGKGDAAMIVAGMVNGVERKFTYEGRFPAETSEHEFIPRLWATRRVGYLLDEIRLHGESAELREEATELARKYGIVTPYTAYLIVEDEARRDVPAPLRSMQRLERDREARDQASRSWQEFKNETAGEKAIAGARAGLALKAAEAPAVAATQALREADAFSRRYGLQPANEPEAGVLADSHAQEAQFVGGKNFFMNSQQWIDAAVQKATGAKRVRLQFGSADYFEFAAKHAETSAWLALGKNVQFVFNGIVYEIYE